MSSDSPRYSEKDVVMAKREAWASGRYHGSRAGFGGSKIPEPLSYSDCEAEAKKRYPLKVERPRVVRDPHDEGVEWRMSAPGHMPRILWRDIDKEHWRDWPRGDYREMFATAERVKVWADLLANPTETVDAD